MVSFEYYRFFYFVAQYKSFTKAAEILNNNQPNITRCMNILENELECKLFVRSNRGVTLTPEGEKLFQHVAIAYEQLSTAESELPLQSAGQYRSGHMLRIPEIPASFLWFHKPAVCLHLRSDQGRYHTIRC